MTAAPSPLTVEREGAVVRVWLDRPEVRNAFNGELVGTLRETFESLAGAAGEGVRAVVLGGRGKAFCAGADLACMREMAGCSWEQNRADADGMAAPRRRHRRQRAARRACPQGALVQDVAGREPTADLRAETARRIADARASDEGREGVQSFLDRRKPGWLLP